MTKLIRNLAALIAAFALGAGALSALASPASANTAEGGVGPATSAETKLSPNKKVRMTTEVVDTNDHTRDITVRAHTVKGKVKEAALKADRIVLAVRIDYGAGPDGLDRQIQYNKRVAVFNRGMLEGVPESAKVTLVVYVFENGKRVARAKMIV